MAQKRKKVTNFKAKIKKYLKENENKILTKNGLNMALGVTKQNISQWRLTGRHKLFIEEYDKALVVMEDWLERGFLVNPQIKFEYWKLAFIKNLGPTKNEKININIDLQTPRVITNE